ncbi:MAG: hypothetical protein AMJ81_07975 [Phycisphaerae bacterium SM23_33]|nr:MAG: hypothetical protein AMJ81_07975 [Phycisphaerae bacterium SM23_33]
MLAVKLFHAVVLGVGGLLHAAISIKLPRGTLQSWRYARVPTLLVLALVFVKCAQPDGRLPTQLGAQVLLSPAGSQGDRAHAKLIRRAQEDPIGLLEEGLEKCGKRLGSYDGLFILQERIDGQLGEPVASYFRFRTSPFSVAMRRLRGKSRITRLLYVEGQNNGQLVVRLSGLLGKLASGVEVDPDGPLARKGCLHAVTDFGLENALKRILKAYKQAAGRNQLDSECLGIGMLEGRLVLTLKKTGPDGSTIVDLDVETLLPVRVRRYTAEDMLLAYYHYKNLNFSRSFTDAEFSREANGLSDREKR